MRSLQRTLSELGPVAAPSDLQTQLRRAISVELTQQRHLPWHNRLTSRWQLSLAPMALRLAGGCALTVMIAGGLCWLFAAPLVSVEANDDKLAHLTPPRYLYSQVPPEEISTSNDAPVIVNAKVDEKGRIYDYQIVSGALSPSLRLLIEQNLLASVFRPATVFGAPVRGHVVLTYAGISVRG
ncbi:MAG: anti-sigma factor [Acidobacteriaceae bacterium]|nr:anti-sigma factor [Acidobacteriaceae bacterium]